MTAVSTRVWLLLAGLSACDVLWCAALRMGLSHWGPVALASLALVGVIVSCRFSGAVPRLAAIAEWILLWLIFAVAGALLTYLAAAQDGPVSDSRLAAADAALGFGFTAWFDFIASYPALQLAVSVAYRSLAAQVLLSVPWLHCRARDDR